MNSSIRTSDGGLSIVVNNKPYTVQPDHPNYAEINKALREKRWSDVPDLITVTRAIARHIEQTAKADSDLGVNVANNSVLFRGEPVHGTVMSRIVDMAREGFDIKPMELFLANLHDNPSNKAITQLYDWMEANGITITEDGHLLAFKRVRDDFLSFYDGKTSNHIGTTPSLPRNKVDDRSEVTCSHGLHFCSHAYLPHYHGGDGRVLLLKINPRDVVSIPTDYGNAKGRACAYLILDELKGDARQGIETHNVIPQPVVIDTNDVNQSNDYKDGYAAGYKDGRGKKATGTSADSGRYNDWSSAYSQQYFDGYAAGRKDGRDKKPNLYGTGSGADTFVPTSDGLATRVFKVIAEQLGLDVTSIKLTDKFIADLGIDSLDVVEIVMALEDEFSTEITDEQAEKAVTVGDALDLVRSLIEQS